MRIGIDFDNTIICYDQVFCTLAKEWRLIDPNFLGTKRELRDQIRLLHGDTTWQRLQGKAYGEFIKIAQPFDGFMSFLQQCQNQTTAELFIVSHKTELGHFDEKNISLRDAARAWLQENTIFQYIPKNNVYFETTRDEKIARITQLQCTHFIDDLPEVLESPIFPKKTARFLFQNNWKEIAHAILTT